MSKFKFGDPVKVNWPGDRAHGCIGVIASGRGKDGDYLVELQNFNGHDGGGALASDRGWWVQQTALLPHGSSAAPSTAPKFLLRYELESNPIEEFATLPDVKKRVKELLAKPDLKRESMKVYEIARVIEVKVSEQITFSTRKRTAGPTKKSKKAA